MRKQKKVLASSAVKRGMERKELQERVLAYGPHDVYCGLLVIQERRHYSEKFALAVFKDLYGTWPRWCDKGEPTELPEIGLMEEWLATRKRKSRKRVAKSAPLVEQMEKPAVMVDAAGFVDGTLMREDDMEELWR